MEAMITAVTNLRANRVDNMIINQPFVKMLLANPHYGFRARQTACDHACHRPVRRAPLRFASSIL